MTPPRKPSVPNGADPSLKATQGRSGRAAPVEKAFDLWLDRGLHDLFDQFADEPVPDHLKDILDTVARDAGASGQVKRDDQG